MDEQSKKWDKFCADKVKTNYPRWPLEPMVKLLFGDYLFNKVKIPDQAAVLDVGCGFGNNLLPFLDKGCSCFGVEITENICKIAKAALRNRGFNATFKVGHNRSIPFKDGSFDILIAAGVIHYECCAQDIHLALKEYCRVLKPNGTLFLSTTGPKHDFYKRAQKNSPHHYEIKNFDFRNGKDFFFFENKKYLHKVLKSHFNIIETGCVTEELMKFTIDQLLAVCKNKISD